MWTHIGIEGGRRGLEAVRVDPQVQLPDLFQVLVPVVLGRVEGHVVVLGAGGQKVVGGLQHRQPLGVVGQDHLIPGQHLRPDC